VEPERLPASQKVVLRNLRIENKVLLTRNTCSDLESPGRTLPDLNPQIDHIITLTALAGDRHAFKETKPLNPRTRCLDLGNRILVALLNQHFTPQHAIPRTRIADHF